MTEEGTYRNTNMDNIYLAFNTFNTHSRAEHWCSEEQQPELSAAVRSSDITKVKQLLDAGSDPDVQDSMGHTPLMWAVDGCTKNPQSALELTLMHKTNLE